MKILLVFVVLSILATLFAAALLRGGKGPARTTRRPDFEPDRRRSTPEEAMPPAKAEVSVKHRESAEDR